MINFFTRDNILKALIILVIITTPIVLAIFFGKIHLSLPFSKQTPTTTLPPIQADTSKVALYCPSLDEFCNSGQMINFNGDILGFGATLSPGSPVKTAFNGKLTFYETTINTQQVQTVRLENTELKTTAYYYFMGGVLPRGEIPTPPNGYVKAGFVFGKVTENISAYNTSLLFQMYKGEVSAKQQQTLLPNSFILSR